MYIRKARAGNIPGYTWHEDGEVLDLEDALGEELVRMPTAGFSRAEKPQGWEPEPPVRELLEPMEEPQPEPKKSPGRPKLPRDAQGKIIR